MKDSSRENHEPSAISVTALGLCTPLGMTFPSSAARGLRRQTNWQEHEIVLVAGDATGLTLRGATVSRVPKKNLDHLLDGPDRAAALLSPALQELFSSSAAADIRYPKCVIRSSRGGDMRDIAETSTAIPLIFDEQTDALAAFGRCCFFEDLILAAERLRKRKSRWEIVGCVDSLCSVGTLRNLMLRDRLLSGRNHYGIVAGETAGVFLLEHEDEARKRNAPSYLKITAWGRSEEDDPSFPSTGQALSQAFRQALETQSPRHHRLSAVIADLNGERHRALDWGYAEGRILSDLDHEPALLHPADLVGDCGNAMGAVLLAAAITRFALHPGAQAIAACTSDEGGARRVLRLEPGDAACRNDIIMHLRQNQESFENAGNHRRQ